MVNYLRYPVVIHMMALLYFFKVGSAVTDECSDVCDFNDWARDASCNGRNLADIPQECRHAKTLQMQDNRVSMLTRGAFSNFTCLKYLYLERNNLSVTTGAFDGCSMLEKVQLSQNHVPTLDEGILEGLSSVLFMFIDEAGLRSVLPNAFQELPDLTFLSLQRNNLTTPPCGAFQLGNSLETLYLTSNQISELPDNCFSNYDGLIRLYLKNNPLREPNALAFQGLDKLQLLDLQHTNLTRVPTGIFGHANKIERLYLSFNNIKHVFSRDFVVLTGLTHLYLQNNGLITIHAQAFEFLASVHTLDVSHNSIKSIEEGALNTFRDLQDLRLQHNQLNSTKNISFSAISTEARIHLADNPLHCDCAIYPFQDWLKRALEARPGDVRLSSTHTKCSSPAFLSQTPVIDVSIRDICPETERQQPPNDKDPSPVENETDTQRITNNNVPSGLTDVQLTATVAGAIALSILFVGFVVFCVMYRRVTYRKAVYYAEEEKKQPGDNQQHGCNINVGDGRPHREDAMDVRITQNPLDAPPALPPRDGGYRQWFQDRRRSAATNSSGRLGSRVSDGDFPDDDLYVSVNGDGPVDLMMDPQLPVLSRFSSMASSQPPYRRQDGEMEDGPVMYSTVLTDSGTVDPEQAFEEEEEEELTAQDWVKVNSHRIIPLARKDDISSSSSPYKPHEGPGRVDHSALKEPRAGSIPANHAGHAGYISHTPSKCVR